MKDKYTAVWVSHSSMSDYLKCPRAYYLRNIYRDPKTNHKVTLMQPALALGQTVHEVIESLSILPVDQRFIESLDAKFLRAWEQVQGKKGGFKSVVEEEQYKERGRSMIRRIQENPGPLKQPAIKVRQELPYFWLSEEDNIILCGKIDWLQYVPEQDGVHIIDFKTGKFDEDPDSLQLPIYYLLASRCQKRPVVAMSYWYIDRDADITPVHLPDEQDAIKRILDVAKKIHLARKLEHFKCPQTGGCRACRPFESIVSGQAEFIGLNLYKQDMYSI